MKTISSLKLRNQLGEVLDKVRYQRQPLGVTRHKRVVAVLIPVEETGRREHQLPKVNLSQISPRLKKLLGAGRYIPLAEEEKEIKKYLASKV